MQTGFLANRDLEEIKPTSKLNDDDIVIAVMGPTGTGKSHIIDTLTGQIGKRAGSGIESHTTSISAVRIKGHPSYLDHLVLVDTPGFDDTNKSDMEILQMISGWMVDTYKKKVLLSGILYLHRVTDNRLGGTPRRNLVMFGKLCGDQAARHVVLVTTMWDDVKRIELAEGREDGLKKYWDPLLKQGATTGRFDNTQHAAWRILDGLITRTAGVSRAALLLQEEMVDLGKQLRDTEAGQELYNALQILLRWHKETTRLLAKQKIKENDPVQADEITKEYQKIQKEFEKTFEEAKKLHIPLGRRFMRIFSRKPKAKALEL